MRPHLASLRLCQRKWQRRIVAFGLGVCPCRIVFVPIRLPSGQWRANLVWAWPGMVLSFEEAERGCKGPPCRYPQVEKVIQVEIDETVPEVAQEFLPEIAAGYQAVDLLAISWLRCKRG